MLDNRNTHIHLFPTTIFGSTPFKKFSEEHEIGHTGNIRARTEEGIFEKAKKKAA